MLYYNQWFFTLAEWCTEYGHLINDWLSPVQCLYNLGPTVWYFFLLRWFYQMPMFLERVNTRLWIISESKEVRHAAQLYLQVYGWEDILNSVSWAIQTLQNFIKNTPLHISFSTLFLVFGYPYETLSFVFDILYLQRKCWIRENWNPDPELGSA